LKYILPFLLLISLVACEEPVTFTDPQPVGTNDLSKFPKRLQGSYISLADNSTLIIHDDFIQRVYDFDYKIHLHQLDSTARLSGDTLINMKTDEKVFVKKENDSLVFHIHSEDTIFQINPVSILRKLKGYYFLNTQYGKGWEVQKIQLAKGQLVISSVSTKQDIENLNEIIEKPQDTIPPYQYTLTKKQFKEFVQNDGFSEGETFVRQKNQ
jgi:hypothetical protein